MPAGSTQHYILLHNPTILHTQTFFAPVCHSLKKISSEKKLSHSSLLQPRALHTSSSTSIDSINSDNFILSLNTKKYIQTKQVDSNTNSSRNIPLFPSLWIWLGLGLDLGLGSNKPLARSRYISLHATMLVAYYFYLYILCKYFHTNKDGGVFDHPCSSQVLHTNEDRVVLSILLRSPNDRFL